MSHIPIERHYTCPWCNTVSEGTEVSCPGCGVSVDVERIVTKSGWIEMPGRKDMSKIQFGHSSLQIEGEYVPVADFNLAPNDGVYFTHHVLLWMDAQVKVSAMSLKGGWKRLFAGLPLIMTEAYGPGHIAFSRDAPGELIALPIQPGQAVGVGAHIFLAPTRSVTCGSNSTGRVASPCTPPMIRLEITGVSSVVIPTRHSRNGETIADFGMRNAD